jgi:hypothetical protein
VAGTGGSTSVLADIPAAGGDTVLTVLDQSGNQVATQDYGNLSGGPQQSLDVSSISSGLPPGNYTFSVSVTPSNGAAANATTYITGTQQIAFANLVKIDD